MRGEERRQRSMLLVVNVEERIPKEHPLKRIKQMADAALKELSPLFGQMYSVLGAAVDSARAFAQSLAADGAVYDSQRADVL